jgi:hypothetical protein
MIVACVALPISACATTHFDAVVSVADVLKNIHSWNGRTVTVEGWLRNCGGYDCGLYQSLEDARIVERGDDSSAVWLQAMDRRLSIAHDETFDAQVAGMKFQKIRLKAGVSDRCHKRFVVCTDRAPDLQPISFKTISNSKEQ